MSSSPASENMKTLSGQSKMMLDVTRFFSGFSGAVGTLFLLMAFYTDYWQLGTESCDTEVTIPVREIRQACGIM